VVAVIDLHEQKVISRDVKMENLVLLALIDLVATVPPAKRVKEANDLVEKGLLVKKEKVVIKFVHPADPVKKAINLVNPAKIVNLVKTTRIATLMMKLVNAVRNVLVDVAEEAVVVVTMVIAPLNPITTKLKALPLKPTLNPNATTLDATVRTNLLTKKDSSKPNNELSTADQLLAALMM
jgi:hypothetical protein